MHILIPFEDHKPTVTVYTKSKKVFLYRNMVNKTTTESISASVVVVSFKYIRLKYSTH